MLKVLLKKQFSEMFRSYFINRKTGEARSKGKIAALFVLFAVLMLFLGGIFFVMALFFGDYLLGQNMDWLYFAMMGLTAILFGTFGSVFNTYSGLYMAKDNDLLISMPIPSGLIVLSRTATVFGMGMLYSMVVWIPTVIYYCIRSFSLSALIGGCVTGIMIGLFVTFLSCVLGWIVALISSRLKNKNVITVLISLVFVGAYWLFCTRLQGILENILLSSEKIGAFIQNWGALIWHMGRGATVEILSLMIFTLVTLVLAGLCYLVLIRTFVKLATRKTGEKKKSIRIGNARAVGTRSALFVREARRFVSSATYMLNTGIGLVIGPVVAVLLALRSDTVLPVLEALETEAPWLKQMLPLAAYLIVTLIAAMNFISTPSVSLEGKSIWLIRSLPVLSRDVLNAKILFGFSLNALSSSISLGILLVAFRFHWLTALILFPAVLLNIYLNSAVGLILGLKHPILTWTSEVVPIKQAVTGFISMLLGWLMSIIIPVGGFFAKDLMSSQMYLICADVLLLIAAVFVSRWVNTRGAKILDQLC